MRRRPERPERVVVCLKCGHESHAPQAQFPERCFGCGAHGSWIIATPEGLGAYARLIDRLNQDPAVQARRRGARGIASPARYRDARPRSQPNAGALGR